MMILIFILSSLITMSGQASQTITIEANPNTFRLVPQHFYSCKTLAEKKFIKLAQRSQAEVDLRSIRLTEFNSGLLVDQLVWLAMAHRADQTEVPLKVMTHLNTQDICY